MSILKATHYKLKARQKGLSLWRNQFSSGWSIIMPGGSTYHAHTDDDMVAFVSDY
jgi:hypothetical protein